MVGGLRFSEQVERGCPARLTVGPSGGAHGRLMMEIIYMAKQYRHFSHFVEHVNHIHVRSAVNLHLGADCVQVSRNTVRFACTTNLFMTNRWLLINICCSWKKIPPLYYNVPCYRAYVINNEWLTQLTRMQIAMLVKKKKRIFKMLISHHIQIS